MALTKQKIDFGDMPERVGRSSIRSFAWIRYFRCVVDRRGNVTAAQRVILIQRFDGSRPDLKKPAGALLNPDGFSGGFVWDYKRRQRQRNTEFRGSSRRVR